MDSSLEAALDELRTLGIASFALSLIKQTKFDEPTVSALKELKERYGIQDNHSSPGGTEVAVTQQKNGNPTMELQNPEEQVAPITEPYVPPEIPPIPSLQEVFLSCRRSKPFERQLTETDVRDCFCRLSIGKKEAQMFVLPMLNPEENILNGINATVYDINGNTFKMILKFWSSKFYVLTGGWNAFKKSHGLQELRDFVTLWAFRHNSTDQLCFAITHRSLPLSPPPARGRRKRLKGN